MSRLRTTIVLVALLGVGQVFAFEGRIDVLITRGNETNDLVYTVGPAQTRIAVTSTNSDSSRVVWPHAVNIVDLESGAVTLVFPNNRTFVRLKSAAAAPATTPLPSTGAGQNGDFTVRPAIPAMPMPPIPPDQELELKQTTDTKDILGFPCTRYDLKQHGQTLEVWATGKLVPFQPYLSNQPSRFGPHRLEEQWPALLTTRKLFPLMVSLHYDNGAERFRFEVKSVKEEEIADPDRRLFQPPKDYHEVESLPF